MRFKKTLIAVISVIALVGCSQDASKTDIAEPEFQGDALPSDYSAKAPDVLTVFQNVDNHPSIVKLCLDGLAFRTVSTTHQNGLTDAAMRVPDWDETCP